MKVHPIQLNYSNGKCGLCGSSEPRKYPETTESVAHLVHLVREHLPEVQRTFSATGRAEEIDAAVV